MSYGGAKALCLTVVPRHRVLMYISPVQHSSVSNLPLVSMEQLPSATKRFSIKTLLHHTVCLRHTGHGFYFGCMNSACGTYHRNVD